MRIDDSEIDLNLVRAALHDMECERNHYQNLVSAPLNDGTRLNIGDCFAVDGEYPFFSDGEENYNAELCWKETIFGFGHTLRSHYEIERRNSIST